MHAQTFMAFDFGTRKIGVAVGQIVTKTARPLAIITYQQQEPDWLAIQKLIRDWRPHALVVGHPLNMDGTQQNITVKAHAFGEALAQRFHLPVHFVDERLSTVTARERVFAAGGYKALQKNAIDTIAAQIILESFLQHYQDE